MSALQHLTELRHRMRRRHVGLWAIALLVLAFLYLPIAMVFVNAFNKDPQLIRWGGATLHWFDLALHSSTVGSALRQTMVVAAITTAISLAIAVTAGLWLRRVGARGRALLDAMTYMRLVLPEVVTALALFVLFRRVNFPLGMSAVVIGHVVFTSAYATLIVQARLAALPRALEDAAADLGARPLRAFRRVTLPLLMPGIAAAGLLTFTFSFDDVVTSTFLAGNSVQTLPMLIFGLVRYRVTPEVNAIGAGVMLITITGFALTALAAGTGRGRIARRRDAA